MPKKTSSHVCEAEGCTTKTAFRRDGKTPLKYCPPHKKESWDRMQVIFAEGNAKRDARRAEFEVVMEIAKGEADLTMRVDDGKIGLVFGPGNSAFVHYLKSKGCAEDSPQGVLVRLPRDGSATALFNALKPHTASGEPLEGIRIRVV